jgi:hypothetical protein
MMLPNRGKNRAWRLVRRAERRRMVPDPAGGRIRNVAWMGRCDECAQREGAGGGSQA